MTMPRPSSLVGVAGLGLLAASVLPGWVEAERVIVGYGSARIVWSQDAWSGFFLPWMPVGAGLAGLAGVLAIVGARDGGVVRTASAVVALMAAAILGAVLAIGRESLSPTPATTWTGEPGWLVPLGIGISLAIALAGLAGRRQRPPRRVAPIATGILGIAVLGAACATAPTATPSPTGLPGAPDWRTDPGEPYPFTTPIPDLSATDLDGEYTRPPTDTYTGDRAACRRCPPFPLDRGESLLRFDRGRYEIVHVEPAYRSYGHFSWDGEVLTLFNDPECGTELGTYHVERDGAELRFDALDDPCAFGQRTRDLTDRTWTPADIARGESCQPPNTEAAVSGHWPAPSGC